MSDIVVDSSVVAKWILPEPDSAKALQLLSQTLASASQLIVLDLALPEVANAIWKAQRRKLITSAEASSFLTALAAIPVRWETAAPLLPAAFDIAVKYDRAVYDALFIALANKLGVRGVTADEPLFNATKKDFSQIILLRNL